MLRVAFNDICNVTKEALQKKLSKRITELRTQKGWNQSDLARACDKDRQAIQKLESREVNPTLYTLHEIAKGLDILQGVLETNMSAAGIARDHSAEYQSTHSNSGIKLPAIWTLRTAITSRVRSLRPGSRMFCRTW